MLCSSSHDFLASAVLPFPASTMAGGNSTTRPRKGCGTPEGGCAQTQRARSVPGTLSSGKAAGVAAGGRATWGRGVWVPERNREAWVNGGLTLARGREADGLGEGGQHRLLRQPEAQLSAQGSGERAEEGGGLVHTRATGPLHLLQAPSLHPSGALLKARAAFRARRAQDITQPHLTAKETEAGQ